MNDTSFIPPTVNQQSQIKTTWPGGERPCGPFGIPKIRGNPTPNRRRDAPGGVLTLPPGADDPSAHTKGPSAW